MKKQLIGLTLAVLFICYTYAWAVWTATHTNVADADIILFQDTSATAGSQDGYITFGNLVANYLSTEFQAYDADMINWPASIVLAEVEYLDGLSGTIVSLLALKSSLDSSPVFTGTLQGSIPVTIATSATTATAVSHNRSVIQMTTADEVTMWDCTASTVGNLLALWARDAEKIEVVPASGDHFVLLAGTALTVNFELDMAATAGTKITLICTAADTWSVYSETAACADGGAAD